MIWNLLPPMLVPLIILVSVLAIVTALAGGRRSNRLADLPVEGASLMTERERQLLPILERALPHCRVHAQVSIGALVRTKRGLDRSTATSARNRFSSKRVDFAIEDRRSGQVVLIVELDDSSHDVGRDADRDAMMGKAGYRTLRIPGERRGDIDAITRTLQKALPTA